MICPVLPLPALVLIVLYFLGLYRLIRLSPYLGLDWTDYWEPCIRHLISPLLIKAIHRGEDDGRGSQALTIIRRPILDIPAADAKPLNGGRIMAVARKQPLLFDG